MSDLGSIIAVIISIVAASIAYWQTKLVRQSIESQTFTTLLGRAKEIDISSVLDFIGTLECTDYTAFQKSVPTEVQLQIRQVVSFFNDLSHMMRSGYVDDFYPIRIYHPGLVLCRQKLLPWWLHGIRAVRVPTLYENFNWLCDYANYLETEMKKKKLLEPPRIGYRRYLKSHPNLTVQLKPDL